MSTASDICSKYEEKSKRCVSLGLLFVWRWVANAGWLIQAKSGLNPYAGQGVAVREYQTDVGPADSVLFVGGKAAGVIEAKKETEGYRLTTHEQQTASYAAAKLKWVNNRRAAAVFV